MASAVKRRLPKLSPLPPPPHKSRMDFLKKHYEKVLLGVVLLGLAAGAAFLTLMIPSERAKLQAQSEEIINRPAKPLEALDLSKSTFLIERMGGAGCLDLSNSNKVFNTLPWLRKGEDNTTLRKLSSGNQIGPEAIEVIKISPLYTTIVFEAVLAPPTADTSARYDFTVEKEAAAKSSQRTRKHYPAPLNGKTDTFVLREVKGPPDNPTELVIEMTDTGERVSLSKEKPYKRVDGYEADLKYPPDNKTWSKQRVGAGGPGMPAVVIASESFIVVAISKNEVVLSAKSNNKKTPRPYTAAP